LHDVAWAKSIGDSCLTWKCIQKYGRILKESLDHCYGNLFVSAKQKLNTKSSTTEAEVVGASDYYLPNCIWTRMFMEAQGYKMKESTCYQDNMSAMKLEKNGKMSAGRKSRHIDIRYFFAKDRVDTDITEDNNFDHIISIPLYRYNILVDYFAN